MTSSRWGCARGVVGAVALVVAALRGAYEFQGQKCSAASRAFIPASLYDDVMQGVVMVCGVLIMLPLIYLGHSEGGAWLLTAVWPHLSSEDRDALFVDAITSTSRQVRVAVLDAMDAYYRETIVARHRSIESRTAPPVATPARRPTPGPRPPPHRRARRRPCCAKSTPR